MKCNVGKTDRILRAVAGVAVIITGVIFGSWFGAIGAVLLFTAAIGWCPAYVPFKLDTTCNTDGSGGCGCSK